MANSALKIKELPQNKTLIQWIQDYADGILDGTSLDLNELFDNETFQSLLQEFINNHAGLVDLKALIEALTSDPDFISHLIANASFRNFLTQFLTDNSGGISMATFIAKLITDAGFLSFLANYIQQHGFTDLAALIAALEADSGFNLWLLNMLELVGDPPPIDGFSLTDQFVTDLFNYPAFITALTDFIGDIAAGNISLALSGDVKGDHFANFINKLHNIPIDFSPFDALAFGVNDDFNSHALVGSVLNAKWNMSGHASNGVVMSHVVDANGRGKIVFVYTDASNLGGDTTMKMSSILTFDANKKQYSAFFNLVDFLGKAHKLRFGTFKASWNDIATAAANGNANYIIAQGDTLPNVSGVGGDIGAGQFYGVGPVDNGQGTDLHIFRIGSGVPSGKFRLEAGGEHGGWTQFGSANMPAVPSMAAYKLGFEIVFVKGAGNGRVEIEYIDSNIATAGALGADLTMKYDHLLNTFVFV